MNSDNDIHGVLDAYGDPTAGYQAERKLHRNAGRRYGRALAKAKAQAETKARAKQTETPCDSQ